ncbi:MAG TPA: PLDc N-terminal domain-containing protein [Kofleriaceae bacterium]|nr:PLDc N-terminal domain-containing protein [Kofleriaceae bacterium]
MLDWLVIAAYVVALLWALVEVVSSDRAAIYKLAWVAVMLVFPVFGLVVYYATADR